MIIIYHGFDLNQFQKKENKHSSKSINFQVKKST